MKKDTLIWSSVIGIGVLLVVLRAFIWAPGMGSTYMTVESQRFVNVGTAEEPSWVDYNSEDIFDHEEAQMAFEDIDAERTISWTKYGKAKKVDFDAAQAETEADPNAMAAGTAPKQYQLSLSRTIGTWIAAFFTLAIFSFLYRDNPLYKIAEACVVGVSAAYWMVVGFWDVIIKNLIGPLFPEFVKSVFVPGADTERELIYLIPLILGIMLLWRLAPKGAWIARWPLAFIIGSTAGMRMIAFMQGDFVSQIRNGIVPLVVTDPAFDIWASIRNLILVGGVLCCLVYFFFSVEHKGAVGKTARVGIWVLMVTFGAAFGYTVMGRIALLAIRFEFLFDDWLWLIDPTGKRTALLTGWFC